MLYDIIKQLQQTSSTNEKLAVMQANKDNLLFKEYMRLVTCPSINFYITAKTFPDVEGEGDAFVETTHWFDVVAKPLYTRQVTGDSAKTWIKENMDVLNSEWQQLFKMLLLKDIRAKIGVTLVNKVWSELCTTVPYQRCSLPSPKLLEKFNTGERFFVQTKGDGMFASLVLNEQEQDGITLLTRAGNKFPKDFVEKLFDTVHTGVVYEGELLCYRNNLILSRKEGNGILNSILQGGELPDDVEVQYVVWNRIPLLDWCNGSTEDSYEDCFFCLQDEIEVLGDNVILVDYEVVTSLKEAYVFNNRQLAQGLEGSIIKTFSHKWKNGTSNECLKLKIEAEIDVEVYDVVEGKGKASGMLGALRVRSSCGKVKCDVGTGMTDKQRKEMWENKDTLIGKVCAIKANDLLTREGGDTMSLFLPVFLEVRGDKEEADSLERIQNIFEAIRLGQI